MSQPMKKMFENSQVPGCGLLQLGSGQASAQSRGDRSPAAIIRSHGHPPPSTSSRTRSFPPCSQVHFTSRTGCCRDTRRLGSRLAPPSPTRGPGKSLSDSVPLRSLLQSGHSSPNALLIELDQVCDPMFTVETRLLIHVASAPAECSQNQDPGPHRTSQGLTSTCKAPVAFTLALEMIGVPSEKAVCADSSHSRSRSAREEAEAQGLQEHAGLDPLRRSQPRRHVAAPQAAPSVRSAQQA
ncbi:unnamed protein product [Rangifer tarandus platyrhynchus]|uniref:Uncharacterized protein n=1 Tax=Rangifer tarandus platyrhynchus TaxID=3082113 RepID=A0ABN8ZI08_RANTA|nr:unnamed protein product [Rangifer tarandus platyrhynchus]